MMGFGQPGMMPLSWLIGLAAVVIVWGCVWMLLSVIGIAPRHAEGRHAVSSGPERPAEDAWQQPDFTPAERTPGSEAVAETEAVRDGGAPR
ncbi:MAG: hypothetical protein HY829_01045 [Actinobacteria bacterium]|nr:hypothetical protein [Actinomycetota bacterium]